MSRRALTDDLDVKRQRILRTAAGAVAELGYDAVRLSDIASRADVSVGALQHHFDTRDSLLAQAFELASADLLDQLRDRAGHQDDARDQLIALIGLTAGDPQIQRRARVWTEFASASGRYPVLTGPIREVYRAWRVLLGETFDRGVDAGLFVPVVSREDVIDMLLTQIDGALMMLAGAAADYDGARMRRLWLETAEHLLGVSLESASPAGGA